MDSFAIDDTHDVYLNGFNNYLTQDAGDFTDFGFSASMENLEPVDALSTFEPSGLMSSMDNHHIDVAEYVDTCFDCIYTIYCSWMTSETS